MKNLSILFFLGLACLPMWAQGLGTETHALAPQPWNGDWMQERLDQMVHGEDFLGYPGPLPKLWYALGLDPDHPSVEFELRERVKRDAPYWYGSCNGWSAASTLIPEPEPIVVNGVKFFAADLKAILAGIWKDNIELPQGRYDAMGITAKSFEEILYNYVGQNRPIIFDVVLGLESWNYPVAAFERTATENGDWVEVSTLVRYANTIQLLFLDRDYDHRRFLEKTYTYRYNSEGTFEWTGSSLTDRPQRAWYTNVPYLASWYVRGNRHANMSTYHTLESLGAMSTSLSDLYEPNNSLGDAALMQANLLMGSLTPDDSDFFILEKSAGEPLALDFSVYDGPEVDVLLLDGQGDIMQSHSGICELSVDLPADYQGVYHFQVNPSGSGETSFYKLKHPETRAWFQLTSGSSLRQGNLKAINLSEDTEAVLSAADEVAVLPALGSLDMASIEAGTHYRGSDRTVWVAEQVDEERFYKTYDRGHPLNLPYIVPHLTCRNGWKTTLRLSSTNSSPIWISVYDIDGTMLEHTRLPSRSLINLGTVLTSGASAQGTWFQLETSGDNRLDGYVTFAHDEINYRSDFALQSRPRNGELVLHNLPRSGEGWLGLSIVNTSGVENLVLYRLLDGNGDVVEDGSFPLGINQKWLGLPSQLLTHEMEDKYSLWFFAQSNVETLALRHDTLLNLDYAHRFHNPILDFPTETFISAPVIGGGTSGYMIGNINDRVNYVRFRGYTEEGVEVVSHRLGNGAMRDYEWRYITYEELLAEAELDPVSHGISYFKVTSSRPILAHELVGLPASNSKTMVDLVSTYTNP